jgi:membrane associated rhomboid family serine protease
MVNSFWLRFRLIPLLVVLLLVVHVINVQLAGDLSQFGVVPRSIDKWHHILLAPFIHANYPHLINNLMGLCIFSALCLLRSVKFFVWSSIFIIVMSGSLVWLFGRSASHIGASGWIFGLWSLSISIAWFDRRFFNFMLAVLVVFLYGGMIVGVLPTDPRVSFEMHLSGAIAGVACAFSYALINRRSKDNELSTV